MPRRVPADAQINQLYPERYHAEAKLFWTPASVAWRAARWLCPDGRARVLDVGSGGGKFCIVGWLATEGRFVGAEQQSELVRVARAAALTQGAKRVRFVHGSAFDVNWSRYDSFYFFNPFFKLNTTKRAFDRAVKEAQLRLSKASPGTRVATFYGMGGPLPEGYVLRSRIRCRGDQLEFWEKPVIRSMK